MELRTDKSRLNARAHKKPSTLKPGMIISTMIIMKAFIRKVNRPRVRIEIGSVNNMNNGLMKALTSPKITVTVIAVRKLFIETPARTLADIYTAKL